jgi:rhodanese-related sulfurtransferase
VAGTNPEPITVDQLLAEARADLHRLDPLGAQAAGGAMIDIRPEELRDRDGEIPGAYVVGRNVLEWRLDPQSPDRNDALVDRTAVIFCDEGYASSLAAVAVRRLGVDATDLVGGFQAWRNAGLPVLSRSPGHEPHPDVSPG